MNKTVQYLKLEMESIRRPQNKVSGNGWGFRTGMTEASFTNRIWEEWEDIRWWRYEGRKGNISQKNHESNKHLTQNIQEIWDSMQRPNQRTIAIEEGEESQLKWPVNNFNKIIEENIPNLKRNVSLRYKITEHQIDWTRKGSPLAT